MVYARQDTIDLHKYDFGGNNKLFFVHIPKTGGNTIFRILRAELRVARDIPTNALGAINRQKRIKGLWSNRKVTAPRRWESSKATRSHSTHIKMDYEIFEQLKLDRFIVFSVVRNPFDRAYSCWVWNNLWKKVHGHYHPAFTQLKNTLPGGWGRNWRLFSRLGQNFEIFLEICALAIERHGLTRWWFSPQASWTHRIHGEGSDEQICIGCPPKVDRICRLENLRTDMEPLCEQVGFEIKSSDFQFKYNKNPIREFDDYRDAYNDQTRSMVSEIYKDDIELLGYTF